MDAASFQRVCDSFHEFHSLFCSLLRPQTVAGAQPELPSGPAGAGPGAAQRREPLPNRWACRPGRCSAFSLRPAGTTTLSWGGCRSTWVAGWDTMTRCGCWTAATSPSRVGNRREWPGSTAAGWARWPTARPGMFLAYVSPLGRALVDKRLYLPESWTSDDARCAAAGVPEERRSYHSKTELALEMLGRALERGHLIAGWVAGDDAFGMSPSFREGLAALGMRYVLDVPGGTTVWPMEPSWTSPDYPGNSHPGFGRPRKPSLVDGQRRTMEQRGDELPDEAWREITVAQGSQRPRTYRFSAQRVRATKRRTPVRCSGPSGDVTWTAASLATTCPTPQRVLPWRPWLMWAVPGGVLKRSSRRKRATWAWTNTRPAPGGAGITT